MSVLRVFFFGGGIGRERRVWASGLMRAAPPLIRAGCCLQAASPAPDRLVRKKNGPKTWDQMWPLLPLVCMLGGAEIWPQKLGHVLCTLLALVVHFFLTLGQFLCTKCSTFFLGLAGPSSRQFS